MPGLSVGLQHYQGPAGVRVLGVTEMFTFPRSINFISFHSFVHQWLYSPLWGPGLFFSFVIFFYTDGATTWTGDQPAARPLLHTNQHSQNKHTYRLPCLEWDTTPRSQCSSERTQFMP
jgi:hypothetical protein